MKKLLIKIDWVLVTRLFMGGMFFWMSYTSKDWMLSLFGLIIVVMGIVGAYTQTGCGYTGCTPRYTRKPKEETISFEEITSHEHNNA